ncbi:chromosome segregation protein SMC [Paenibacillus naphthalenovorans]|uniref:AAA family ATPase n=1 Tax=Paenibacillus naphthalenovorans TaxID=162209 RepID=UPI0010B443B4|nr:AAA family ATPase [Paenibacillus naphthalenovorans]GCL74853.1 chromosome segregation protein SMC [Paenibacillus naphthalenovorans]
MAKLDRLIVHGFKSIEELDLELTDLNVLIGANGAGKSNLISFFKMLNEMINKRFQVYITKSGGAERLLYFGVKNTDQIDAKLFFGQNSYEIELEPTQEGKLMFASEIISFHKPGYSDPWSKNLGAGHLESLLFKESKDNPHRTVVADHIIRSLRDWKLYHFHDTGDTSRIKSDSDLNDNENFRPDASNLAAFLYRLKEKENDSYLSILKTVRLIAPFIEDFVLEPSRLNEGFIRLAWSHSEYEGYFDVSQLSDGTLRFICIATLLLQPKLPTTILLDEPELGLHPYAINVLASLFKSVSKKTQIIVSTQSLLLVDQLEPEDIVVVNYSQKSSEFIRLDSIKLQGWLEDYTLGELWEKNILGGRPR